MNGNPRFNQKTLTLVHDEFDELFSGMVDRLKALILISSRDHCRRFSPSHIFDTSPTGFEPTLNLISEFVG